MHDFYKRLDDELALRKSSPLDPKRAACFNRTAVATHFTDFEALQRSHGPFKARDTYNFDEHAALFSGGRKSCGVKGFNSREKYRKRSGELDMVTICECVSADGVAVTPGFIFSSSYYEWFRGCPEEQDIW